MLAKRYGKMPSEIVYSATTLDLQIFDIAVSYENYKEKLSQGHKEVNLSEEEMLAAMTKIRNEPQ